jgi:post-segregation antitoxin (ccd killing protein)
MASVAMRRILRLEKKNRVKTSVHIEEEFFNILKDRHLSISDITNVALERFMKDQGMIKP